MTIMINDESSMLDNFSKIFFKRYRPLVLLGLLCVSSLPALAKDYKIEVIIFENLVESRAYEPHSYEKPEEMLSKADTWAISPTMLVDAAKAINNSANYRLLQHYSWGQETLPYSQSAAYHVVDQRVNGWLKIYASQLLFANIDIDFNGYRMNEKRRLKLNERHFFDHPKFGILMQVSRLEEEPEQLDETN